MLFGARLQEMSLRMFGWRNSEVYTQQLASFAPSTSIHDTNFMYIENTRVPTKLFHSSVSMFGARAHSMHATKVVVHASSICQTDSVGTLCTRKG